MRKFITPEPKIVSIDSQPLKANSSYGKWRVDYSIKWNTADKNPIGTMVFFWSRQEAQTWIDNNHI